MTSTQNRNETVVQVETVGPIAAGLQAGDESPGFGGESGAAWREEEIFPISWVSPAFPSTGTAPDRRGTGLIRRKIVTLGVQRRHVAEYLVKVTRRGCRRRRRKDSH